MKDREWIDSLFATADIHVKRLKYGLRRLQGKYPITVQQVEELKEEDLLLWELLTSRFSRLQDLLGNKIFTVVLSLTGENVDSWTMIDKVNKLEKLGLLPSSGSWLEMRLLRNHLSHEYPTHPEITANYLNQTVEAIPLLLKIVEELKRCANEWLACQQ